VSSVVVTCDRCGHDVEGLRTEQFTAGFYNVSGGGAWSKYAREGEECVCDACMWVDPAYAADYSSDSAARQFREASA
jgi:hypothetical protein